jgi:PAS domain S-box-containing protein
MQAVGTPWFRPSEAKALADFWHVYEEHYDEMQAVTQELAAGHPEFGPIIRAMTPEQMAAENARSREKLRRAIAGAWGEYQADLETQGAVYARMGLSFASWFELVRAMNRELVPHLIRAYGSDPGRLAAAQLAWDDFISRAMVVIGEAYLKTKEALVRAAEARNEAILSASIDPILTLDEERRVTGFNSAAERVFGTTWQEAAGKPFADFLAEAPSDESGDTLGRRVEISARRADGSVFPAELALISTPNDGKTSYTAYLRDLSTRRREEEATAIWTHVLEQSDFGIVVVDAATRNIRFVNPRCVRLYGYDDAEDLVGKRAETVMASSWNPQFEEVLREIEQQGHTTFEAIQQRKDGSTFPALISTTLIRTASHGALGVSNVVDITERRNAAEARERARDLEIENRRVQEANRLKSEFLANMSHELRTPLNSILGFTEVLLTGDVDPASPEHDEFLGDILTSGQHLLRLINDILDLSKVEAGKLEFRPEGTTFATVAAEVTAVVRPTAVTRDVRLIVEEGPKLDLFIDPARLKQVLYNYLSNAIKFTGPKGTITLRGRAEGEQAFRVEVEDTGVGIAPEDLNRLFIEFQQLEEGAAKRHGGTGLGLALTKRLVEAQGGSVGVTSVKGRGSTFFAVLPRRARVSTMLPESRTFAGRLPGAPRILVVEDDAKDQAVIVAALVNAGFEVETAATGAQAVVRARDRRFDAVTLDLILPDMSGLDVLAAIRKSGASTEAKVVVVSVTTNRGVVGALAVDEFLAKPIEEAQLVAALRRLGVSPERGGHVLVVDDDPSSLRLMRATLSPLGYRVEGRPDGASALSAISQETPAVVILDLLMPVMDGFEFLARLRADAAHRTIPVIVWTSKDLSNDERVRLRENALSVVAKGHGSRSLVDELRLLVTSAAPERQASRGG